MKLWQYLQRTAKRTINIHISLYVISSGTTSFILNIFINKFRFLFLFLNDKFVAFLRGHRSYCVLVGPLLSTIDVCFFWQIEVFLFLFIFFFLKGAHTISNRKKNDGRTDKKRARDRHIDPFVSENKWCSTHTQKHTCNIYIPLMLH